MWKNLIEIQSISRKISSEEFRKLSKELKNILQVSIIQR